jgi:hypothetical protein
VAWLIIAPGLAEAVYFLGNMAFYYQEFPRSMVPLFMALGSTKTCLFQFFFVIFLIDF